MCNDLARTVQFGFLRNSIARQWRVASFVLESFLSIPMGSREDYVRAVPVNVLVGVNLVYILLSCT